MQGGSRLTVSCKSRCLAYRWPIFGFNQPFIGKCTNQFLLLSPSNQVTSSPQGTSFYKQVSEHSTSIRKWTNSVDNNVWQIDCTLKKCCCDSSNVLLPLLTAMYWWSAVFWLLRSLCYQEDKHVICREMRHGERKSDPCLFLSHRRFPIFHMHR